VLRQCGVVTHTLSQQQHSGCPISRSFFARCGIPLRQPYSFVLTTTVQESEPCYSPSRKKRARYPDSCTQPHSALTCAVFFKETAWSYRSSRTPTGNSGAWGTRSIAVETETNFKILCAHSQARFSALSQACPPGALVRRRPGSSRSPTITAASAIASSSPNMLRLRSPAKPRDQDRRQRLFPLHPAEQPFRHLLRAFQPRGFALAQHYPLAARFTPLAGCGTEDISPPHSSPLLPPALYSRQRRLSLLIPVYKVKAKNQQDRLSDQSSSQ